jgi:hypothetical protein
MRALVPNTTITIRPHGALGAFVAMNVGEIRVYENFSEYHVR